MLDAAEHGLAADRPCRCAQDRWFFENCCPDLSMLSSQGRRLKPKPLGRTQPQVCFKEAQYHARIARTGEFACTKELPMPYVHDLRALVGQRPLILVAAGVLICNAAGDLLLQRRTDDQLWGIPGGSMEIGESTEETARREVWEETGLVVGRLQLFDVFSGANMYHVYPNGDQVAIVSVVYQTVTMRDDMPVCGAESLELQYFTRVTLRTVPLSPPNKPIIERFLQIGTEQSEG